MKATKPKSFDLKIDSLKDFDIILISAKIYMGGFNPRWSNYDGKVTVQTDTGQTIVTPLTAQELGAWCSITKIINLDPVRPMVKNLNQVSKKRPVLSGD